MSKQFLIGLSIAIAAIVGLQGYSAAETAKIVPAFEMRDLEEKEHRLTDEYFKNQPLLIVAFGTWQDVSIKQAAEIETFHKDNPEVKIIAFIVDDLPAARDFRTAHNLSFPCYKMDSVSNLKSTLGRLFDAKKGKKITLDKLPFAILTDSKRAVKFSNIGLTDANTLAENK